MRRRHRNGKLRKHLLRNGLKRSLLAIKDHTLNKINCLLDGLDSKDDDAVLVVSASRSKLEGKCEDLSETEAEESESEEWESQDMNSLGSWQKLNYRTIVSGPSLQENLEISVSCRFCHADVSAKYGVGSSWIVSCCNEQCPSLGGPICKCEPYCLCKKSHHFINQQVITFQSFEI